MYIPHGDSEIYLLEKEEKSIAQEIIILRSERGWTQQELANRIQTTQRTVAAWEVGDSIPRKAMRVRLAQVFDLPEEYFQTNSFEEPKQAAPSKDTDQLLMELDKVISDQQYQMSEEKKACCGILSLRF